MARARASIIALLVLIGAGAASARPALPPGKLLVLGDSLSSGYGLPAGTPAWPDLLAARLAAERRPYRVVNASVSGDTSAGGRARLPALLARHRPVLVLLALGANDGLRGQDLRAVEANLGAMIRACRRSDAAVLLLGIELPPNYGARYTAAMRALYGELAARHGVALMPFLLRSIAAERGAFQADGLHPTAAGLRRVEADVWRVLGAHFALAPPP